MDSKRRWDFKSDLYEGVGLLDDCDGGGARWEEGEGEEASERAEMY